MATTMAPATPPHRKFRSRRERREAGELKSFRRAIRAPCISHRPASSAVGGWQSLISSFDRIACDGRAEHAAVQHSVDEHGPGDCPDQGNTEREGGYSSDHANEKVQAEHAKPLVSDCATRSLHRRPRRHVAKRK